MPVGLSGAAPAQAKLGLQTAQGVVRPDSATVISEFDRQFAMDAFAGNIAEVALGQLAKRNSRNEQVRRYGDRLIADHQAANESLAPIATRYQIELPSRPKEEARATHEELERLSGTRFDRQFVQEAIRDHEKDLDMYAKALSELKNPELRAYASQTVPVLREHLRIAQQIERSQTPVSRAPQPAPQSPTASSTQRTPDPPGVTALLNELSADGYRVTSDFSRAGTGWIARAERNGEEVTILYDPQTRQYREQRR